MSFGIVSAILDDITTPDIIINTHYLECGTYIKIYNVVCEARLLSTYVPLLVGHIK